MTTQFPSTVLVRETFVDIFITKVFVQKKAGNFHQSICERNFISDVLFKLNERLNKRLNERLNGAKIQKKLN